MDSYLHHIYAQHIDLTQSKNPKYSTNITDNGCYHKLLCLQLDQWQNMEDLNPSYFIKTWVVLEIFELNITSIELVMGIYDKTPELKQKIYRKREEMKKEEISHQIAMKKWDLFTKNNEINWHHLLVSVVYSQGKSNFITLILNSICC